jgi:deoxyribodipyrimidine photo-lyase
MIQKERIKQLNSKGVKTGDYILYWMQASPRVEFNHALEYSIYMSNKLDKPIIVYFGMTDKFLKANERHYYFMLEGLKELQSSLFRRGIKTVILKISPEIGVTDLSIGASMVITDRGYLNIQKNWHKYVAERIECPLIQVETNVVVPVEEASPKEEFSAGTFRPKINEKLDYYLIPLEQKKPNKKSISMDFESLEINDPKIILNKLKIDREVKKVDSFIGGLSEAKKYLNIFLKEKLNKYEQLRNDPSYDYLSNMSPYLHFGQISPLQIALEVLKNPGVGKKSYLEELIVRRELSMNLIYYNPQYDSYNVIPEWAKKTLKEHEDDPRHYLYTLRELEEAETHDPYWNAAQKEMLVTGKMHGYMRMYWGKKIIEWSLNPTESFETMSYLNDKYELDGRDPNGYTGIAWCFGKHDRAWSERPIFGKIRYMNSAGLERKFKINKYVEKVNSLSIIN